MTRLSLRSVVALLVAVTAAAFVTASSPPARAWVSGNLWDPGLIISDAQFYDGDAMTVDQIQAFLNSKVPTCHPEWSSGPGDPIVCLKDYRQTTITRAADAYCPNAYVGGTNESAATIIYKAALACNVSPRVILVTLQKEQGLVTHTWPSSYRYDIAMGFGCPDTGSGCMSEYYGFQNQVWRAARQFQRYRLLPTSYNYRAGVTNIIGYNPNAACGSQSVFIQNSATAALYNYTPYVPNSAALNAIPGTGNSCSSYGNRNFWMYYWEWFGSPVAVNGGAEIDRLYTSMGGVSGVLGAKLATRPCPLGTYTCWQDFEGGIIGWSQADGAWPVLAGEILDAYVAAGGPDGPWGVPVSGENPITSPNGDGRGQNFRNVQALSSAAGTYAVSSLVLPSFTQAGWVRGDLGWPTAIEVCQGLNCAQVFQGGVLARVGPSAFQMSQEVTDKYIEAGGPTGWWGVPTSLESAIQSPTGDGRGENFTNVQVLSSNAGMFAVPNALRSEHARLGWVRSGLGWPVSDAVCTQTRCSQDFQYGNLTWTGSKFLQVTGPISIAYAAAGGVSGPWGAATSTVSSLTSVNGNGQGQNFEQGQALSSAQGTFFVPKSVLTTYGAAGWIRGSLGWPKAAAVCEPSGACTQQFQGGTISVPAGGGMGIVSSGAIGAAYAAAGGVSGPWGAATSTVSSLTSVNGNGQGQNFEQGQALSSAQGTFFVPKSVLTTYGAAGWIRGSLGWPKAAAVCEPSGACTQQFQGGTISVPAGGGAGRVTLG